MRYYPLTPLLILGLLFLLSTNPNAQTVQVGQGSYTTTLPAGRSVPSTANGVPAIPRVSAEFNQLIQTNDYWSNLIFPNLGSNHLNDVPAHPLTISSTEKGFNVGYLNTNTTLESNYYFKAENSIRIGISGLTSNRTSTQSYGDWTFSAKMEFDNASLTATTGHGLPYTFFEVEGGEIEITSGSTFSIWYQTEEVIGLSIDDINYALFAPSGSAWSGTDTLSSSLNNKSFLSIAVLPDSTLETLEFYRKHAYAQVTNSTVSWEYDELNANLISTFSYETILRDSLAGNLNETLTALYRHQWINTSDMLTNYTYLSPRGEMKVLEGNSFSTTTRFSGILPSLPDVGNYNRIQLIEYVQQVANEFLPIADTYNNGKQIGRFAELVHIADQLGAIAERDHFLAEIKLRLEDWFTAGDVQQYYYDETWNTLIGYPANHGSAREINDHHFHSAYAIKAAATIAQYDTSWASLDNWGGMVNLLIRDANNWNRDDELFPFLRNFDAYAGHAWASGHGDFNFGGVRPGNNQESSSESMNFSTATILWGEITGQSDIRDLGIFLYANENEAIDQYWFDVDDEVYPNDFPYKAAGIVWGDGVNHGTWFGNDPEFIHGINMLPINGGSLYLGKDPEYVIENYNEVVSERGGQPIHWKDIFWQYLSMSDADLALSYYNADLNYEPFDGESRAHTMHWLYNMKAMGQYNTEVTADVPSYAVFVNSTDDTTYVAYNAGNMDRMISFSDGFSFVVPAKSMATHQTALMENPVGTAPEPSENPDNVISIFSDTYVSAVSAIFNIDDGQTTQTNIEVINGNNVLKYENLDFQTTKLDIPLNVLSRTNLHIDYYTEDATDLQLFLISSDMAEKSFEFTITTEAWQNVIIPLTEFTDVVDLNTLDEIRIEGNGTVYIDNIFFHGDTPVPIGPSFSADSPKLDSVDVISIFSDTYSNLEGVNLNPDWQQSTMTSVVQMGEDNILLYENLNYQGTEFGSSIDVSEMEWFHLDYWTGNSTELQVYLISPGPIEKEFDIAIKQNNWQSIDIPLSEYSDVVNLNEVFQIKIVGNGTIYLDNLYFGKTSALTVAPTPIHDSDKVVSLFSNAYENVTVDTWSAVWDQANVEDVQINGDDVKLYSGLGFAGIEFISNTIDGTDLTHFHFDMWTKDPTELPVTFKVKLVDFGANGVWSGGDDVEHELTFDAESTPPLASMEWVSFDIPLSDFANMTTREHLAQLLFVSRSEINEFYLDNVYFYTGDLVNNDEEIEIPTNTQLSQNYPNPFNPSTNIEFSLPNASQVSLIIYNSLGQQVAKLLDTRLNQGAHSVTWNAAQIPSGVYFYQLKTANITLTKRMLLIK